MFQELTVDLRHQPEDRWHLTPAQRQQARELLALYKTDLGLRPDLGQFLSAAARELVRAGHWAEMESLARSLGLPIGDIVLCNFYYDLLRLSSAAQRSRLTPPRKFSTPATWIGGP